jgi:hypothetical protein
MRQEHRSVVAGFDPQDGAGVAVSLAAWRMSQAETRGRGYRRSLDLSGARCRCRQPSYRSPAPGGIGMPGFTSPSCPRDWLVSRDYPQCSFHSALSRSIKPARGWQPRSLAREMQWQLLFATVVEWTPARIRVFREVGLCLSQDEFATALGFAKRTVGNAERHRAGPSSLPTGRLRRGCATLARSSYAPSRSTWRSVHGSLLFASCYHGRAS